MKRWLLLLLFACGPNAGTESIAAPDLATYDELHPYLEVRCATLDCHGDPGRPLRLYAETGLRLEADRNAPLSDTEREANALALVGVDPGAPSAETHLVFLKPLAEREGGMDHVGDTVWESRDDSGAQCLLSWLEGRVDRPACEMARSQWMLPPE